MKEKKKTNVISSRENARSIGSIPCFGVGNSEDVGLRFANPTYNLQPARSLG